MSTHHPIRKRQQHCSQHPSPHKRNITPQLRLLAPKGNALPSHPETTVKYRLHNNIKSTEGSDHANDVNLQQSATSQTSTPASSSHNFTLSPLLWPGRTFSSLEQEQDSAVAPYPNTYANWPLASVGRRFPELSLRDQFPRVDILQSHGLSTHHLPDGNLQLQETTQNHHGEPYLIPMLDSPEDAAWATMVQPTIGVHQNQWLPSDQYPRNQFPPDQFPPDQYSSVSIQQLPPVQLAYHAPLQQNSQYVACVNCPSIWCFHHESIMFSDPTDKGINNLKRSYRDLRQHIHEVHYAWHYGADCALCENLFCYHSDKVVLLEIAKGDLCEVKSDLRSSFKMLRDHIQEAHGGC